MKWNLRNWARIKLFDAQTGALELLVTVIHYTEVSRSSFPFPMPSISKIRLTRPPNRAHLSPWRSLTIGEMNIRRVDHQRKAPQYLLASKGCNGFYCPIIDERILGGCLVIPQDLNIVQHLVKTCCGKSPPQGPVKKML